MGGWNSDVSGWGSDRGTVKNLFGDGTNTTLLHKRSDTNVLVNGRSKTLGFEKDSGLDGQ